MSFFQASLAKLRTMRPVLISLFLLSITVFFSQSAASQTPVAIVSPDSLLITGTVSDKSTGERIPFVKIELRSGITFVQGTLTDIEGRFYLISEQDSLNLVISGVVGFRDTILPVTSATAHSLNIQLTPAPTLIETGYGYTPRTFVRPTIVTIQEISETPRQYKRRMRRAERRKKQSD